MNDPDRFFDAETGGDVRLQLERDGAGFQVLRQIGYRDRHHDQPFVVPIPSTFAPTWRRAVSALRPRAR